VAGESAVMVGRMSAGWALPPSDIDGIVALLVERAEAKLRGEAGPDADRPSVARFERRSLSRELAGVLAEVTDDGR
jgi:hypothetical protein